MYKISAICFSVLLLACTVQEAPKKKKVIQTDEAPGAIGVYSQAIQYGDRIWVSGQIGLIPGTRELSGETIEAQTHQSLKNVQAILQAAGFELKDVVEATVFLSDLDDYQAFNEVYVEYFSEDPPARAVVEASRIPLDAKVEIKLSAVK